MIFIASGGGNSGTAESNIPFNRPAGTYYIVIDGWQQAKVPIVYWFLKKESPYVECTFE